MTKNERISYQDILSKDKLEASMYLLYREEYRELSSEAKLIYQYILKRFSITEMKFEQAIENDNLEDFTFIDKNNKLFCFVSNDELEFVYHISDKTVIKAKKELQAVNLLSEEQQGLQKNNRLYLHKVVMDLNDKTTFKQDLNKFKEEKAKKRKAKNEKRKAKSAKKTSEPQPIKSSNDAEPENLQFNETENIRFKNRKNSVQSTKESFSTSESFSTKESIYLSKLNELDKLPMTIRITLKKHIDRLIDNSIDPYDIYSFYFSSENKANEFDFNTVLGNVLSNTKGSIRNINHLLVMAIQNYMYDLRLIPDYEEMES